MQGRFHAPKASYYVEEAGGRRAPTTFSTKSTPPCSAYSPAADAVEAEPPR